MFTGLGSLLSAADIINEKQSSKQFPVVARLAYKRNFCINQIDFTPVIQFSRNGVPQPVFAVPPPKVAIWSVDFWKNH